MQVAPNWHISEGLDPQLQWAAEKHGRDLFHPALRHLWTLIRERWGRPLAITSTARSQDKQNELVALGLTKARVSAHVPVVTLERVGRPCLAMDIDAGTPDQNRALVRVIEEVTNSLREDMDKQDPDDLIRIGCEVYGYRFVHLDVAPQEWLPLKAAFGMIERAGLGNLSQAPTVERNFPLS